MAMVALVVRVMMEVAVPGDGICGDGDEAWPWPLHTPQHCGCMRLQLCASVPQHPHSSRQPVFTFLFACAPCVPLAGSSGGGSSRQQQANAVGSSASAKGAGLLSFLGEPVVSMRAWKG